MQFVKFDNTAVRKAVLHDFSSVETLKSADGGIVVRSLGDVVSVKADGNIRSVNVYNASGAMVASATPAGQTAMVATGNLAGGVYFVNVVPTAASRLSRLLDSQGRLIELKRLDSDWNPAFSIIICRRRRSSHLNVVFIEAHSLVPSLARLLLESEHIDGASIVASNVKLFSLQSFQPQALHPGLHRCR